MVIKIYKSLFFICLLFLSSNLFGQNNFPPYQYFGLKSDYMFKKREFNHIKPNFSFNYLSPIYVYDSKLKISITKDIKFWAETNPNQFAKGLVSGEFNNYRPILMAHLRFLIHWKLLKNKKN